MTSSWNRVSIGSDNGLSPIRRQAIIWTNAGLLSIGSFETNFIGFLPKIQSLPFGKMHLKISSAKRRPFYPGAGGKNIALGQHSFALTTYPLGICAKYISTTVTRYKISSRCFLKIYLLLTWNTKTRSHETKTLMRYTVFLTKHTEFCCSLLWRWGPAIVRIRFIRVRKPHHNLYNIYPASQY